MFRRVLICLFILAAALGLSLPAEATTYATQFGRIQYSPPGPDTPITTARLNGEYVTITLHASTSRQLKGWAIYDLSGHKYVFPVFVLKGGKSVRVHTGTGRNTATDLYAGYRNYIWTNTGDRARLRDNTNKLLDECTWKSTAAGYTNC